MTATIVLDVEELNKAVGPLGWWVNPEAPEEDVKKILGIVLEWAEVVVAEQRQKRILQVVNRKRLARRRRNRR